MAGRRQPGHPEQSPALARNAVGSRSRAASGPRAPARVRPSPPLPSIFLYRSSQSSPPKVSQTHRTPQGPTRAIAIPHSLLPTALLLKHRTAAAPPPTPRKRVMAHKRPLDAAPPEQEAARSPRKRLRRTVLVMMWLERRRARAVTTVGQMAQMVRQAQLDVAKLFMLLVVLVARLGSMERLLLGLPNLLQRMLETQFDAFHRSLMVSIQDTIRSTVQTEIRQTASLPNGSEPPRQISEGFPETGGITRVKLRFVDVDRPEDPLFTGCPVQWQNGRNAKVAIFGNDRQIMQGGLSKLQIEILAVHADFFTEQGQEDFTKEEFNKQIYMHKGKELVLTTVNLTNGESSLGSFLFPESSHGKKLRLTARVKRQVRTTRVQEAITDPFVVKDRRSELNKKSYPPSKEEPVHCLEKISLKGKHCTILVEKKITTVKHLMRHYHRDESGLQKLTGMKKGAWNTMINHATTCVPGNEMYSYWAPEDKCEILFNDLYDLVGKMTDDDYVPYSVNDVDQFPQHKVNNWKKSAYKKFDERESSGDLTPDYFMNNGRPVRAVPHDAGPSVQEFGDRRPLNGFSRATVLSNNDTGPSNKETLPFSQHMYQGLGQHDPSMTQNGTPDYQGNVLNDQGSFSAQPTIPSHILVPPPQDDMITGASITGQGTSSLNHVPSDISSGSPSVQARTPWQYPNGMAAHHEFGDRHPLNGFSRAKFLSNNDAGSSNQETLLFPQHTYQGFGQHNPSMSQNGTPDYVPQGTILNDQGRFSAESTIPPHNFSPVPRADMITGASLAGQQHGYLSFSTTDAPGTSYPVADVAGTSSDGVSLGTSSLNHVQTDIFSGLTPIQFQVLLELQAPLADQDFAQTNSKPPNSDSQFQGYEHDGGAR